MKNNLKNEKNGSKKPNIKKNEINIPSLIIWFKSFLILKKPTV